MSHKCKGSAPSSRRGAPQTVVALAGNPNVGKSTVFNALTGMNQHTGNWPGKTVAVTSGTYESRENSYRLVDIPGTYSLLAHSREEEVARDFVCFGGCDAAVVVCDASCLERNMNLVLQVAEAVPRTVVCVNLLDEARRRGISVDLSTLSRRLGLAAVGAVARKKKTLNRLCDTLDGCVKKEDALPFRVPYPKVLEEAVAAAIPFIETRLDGGKKHPDARWVALRLIEGDPTLLRQLDGSLGGGFTDSEAAKAAVLAAKAVFDAAGVEINRAGDMIASALVALSEDICREAVKTEKGTPGAAFDRRLDKVLTGRIGAYPIMLLLLCFIFWLTLVGANYPSEALSALLMGFQDKLHGFLMHTGLWEGACDALVYGAYRVLAWVVSVMLPPMAIFFPLFTLLEDFGYLPRIAFNLDKPFRRCRACGKQALTMCMGFGCNAAGVVGCRIIDSPRERLLAVLTNNFVPCNGRFPMMLTVLTVFFAYGSSGASSFTAVLLLCAVVLCGIGATFGVTALLSHTVLRGQPSSFTLELPPYRIPQVGRVIVRSIFDRTLFVLGRAAAVAAPAGLIIWLCANINIGDASILSHFCDFLEPVGSLMGLDGTILAAFILGLPANEIVVPIMLMAYLSQGTLADVSSIVQLREILTANGWTPVTAVCMLIFSLMHWPCSTTIITVYRETRSVKWTLLSALIPTLCGFVCCTAVNGAATLINSLIR